MNAANLIKKSANALESGNTKTARSCLKQVLAKQPRHSAALYLMGIAAFRDNQLKEAAGWLRQAIDVQGNAPEFHNMMGVIKVSLEEYAQAVACFEKTLELQPGHLGAGTNLAVARNKTGDVTGAIRGIKSILKMHPGCAEGWNILGNALRSAGNLPEAREAYEKGSIPKKSI